LDIEEKMKLYEWQDKIEELNLLKNRNNEVLLKRVDKKESERANHISQLVDHYNKMRKYFP